MSHPLDGIRPRHALCASCGYVFGGVPIQRGVIICPECGKATPFDLREHSDEIEKLRARIRTRRIAALVIIGLVVVAVSLVLSRG